MIGVGTSFNTNLFVWRQDMSIPAGICCIIAKWLELNHRMIIELEDEAKRNHGEARPGCFHRS